MAKWNQDNEVVATDISSDALEVARENRRVLGEPAVELSNCDLVSELPRSVSPKLIVANLPWGSPDYLLESHSLGELSFMPEISIFPSRGLVGTYVDLIQQIAAKGWQTTLLCETGVLPRRLVVRELGQLEGWQWLDDRGYGMLRVDF